MSRIEAEPKNFYCTSGTLGLQLKDSDLFKRNPESWKLQIPRFETLSPNAEKLKTMFWLSTFPTKDFSIGNPMESNIPAAQRPKRSLKNINRQNCRSEDFLCHKRNKKRNVLNIERSIFLLRRFRPYRNTSSKLVKERKFRQINFTLNHQTFDWTTKYFWCRQKFSQYPLSWWYDQCRNVFYMVLSTKVQFL